MWIKFLLLKYFSVSGLLVIFFSCNNNPVEIGDVESFHIQKITTQDLTCRVDIPITNKSIFRYTISDGELLAYANEEEIGTARLIEKLQISSFSTKTYPIYFTIKLTNPEATINMAMKALLGKKNSYLIRGSVHANSFFVDKKIYIHQSFEK